MKRTYFDKCYKLLLPKYSRLFTGICFLFDGYYYRRLLLAYGLTVNARVSPLLSTFAKTFLKQSSYENREKIESRGSADSGEYAIGVTPPRYPPCYACLEQIISVGYTHTHGCIEQFNGRK